MELLFIIGSVQAFFLATIVVAKRPLHMPDRFLVAWMIFLGLHLLGVYLAASGFYRVHPEWYGFDAAFILIEGPLLWTYIRLATDKTPRLKSWDFLHLIPYVLFTTWLLIRIHLPETSDRYAYIVAVLASEDDWMIQLFGLFNHLHLVVYLIVSFLWLRHFRRRLSDEFSFTEGVNLKWLEAVLIGLMVISGVIVVGLVMSDALDFISHDTKAYLIYSVFSLLPFYLSFMAIRRQLVYPYENFDAENVKYGQSPLTKADSEKCAAHLTQMMETNRPYLNGHLTIKDLADSLDIHPKYLSQVINENFGQNFFNYVNYHRVQEVKTRLASGKYNHLTLLGIGMDCGFNTKSSFNTIFRKMEGITPSEYKAKHS